MKKLSDYIYHEEPAGIIYLGDVLEVLKSLDSGIVQTCITSPPYWGLRDYGEDGQYGLEKTPEEFIDNMVKAFGEVRRVLRDDGTLWLNMGETYAHSGACGGESPVGKRNYRATDKLAQEKMNYSVPDGLKPKDLCGMPWRLALALQTDGWYLRSDIIWHKPNPMPESVTDRPTKSHEHIFLLTKKPKYFYDADAVRENYSESYLNDNRHKTGSTDKNMKDGYDDALAQNPKQLHRLFDKPLGSGSNLRDVWTIPTQSCSFAHFATFPAALVDKCIMAGTPEKTCAVCRRGWERIVDYKANYGKREPAHCPNNVDSKVDSSEWKEPTRKTIGFRPACDCKANNIKSYHDTGKSIVLDPFGGTGTTAKRAKELGRNFIYIDLSEKYNDYAKQRLNQEELPL